MHGGGPLVLASSSSYISASIRIRRTPCRKKVRLYSIIPRRALHVSVLRSTTSASWLTAGQHIGILLMYMEPTE